MKKLFALLLLCAAPLVAAGNFGIVNMDDVLSQSKFGKQEQSGFEALQKQFQETIETIDTRLQEIDQQAQNPDEFEMLSDEAKLALQKEFQGLYQQRNQQEQQAMQVLQQERYRLMQNVNTEIMRGSQIVAKAKKLDLILREEALFFSQVSMNVTKEVISEMDKRFDEENKSES